MDAVTRSMNWLRKLFTRPAPQSKAREKQLLRARLIAVAVANTRPTGALSSLLAGVVLALTLAGAFL